MANQQEEAEMQQQESIYAKLRKIQLELKAPKSQFNSFGKYHYRNQEDILEAVKPLLAKYGLTQIVSDEIVEHKERIYVEATVTVFDDKGEHITVKASAREEQDKKGMDGAQVTGASSSYARKYALNGMYAIDDTKDADSGAPNTQPKPQAQAAPQRPAQQPQQSMNDVTPPAMATDVQLKQIVDTMKAKGYNDKEQIVDILLTVTGSPNVKAITKIKADNLLQRLFNATKEQIDAGYQNLKNPYRDDAHGEEPDMEGYRPEDI